MSELLQQTIYMDLEQLNSCTEVDDEGNENFVQTNFDVMVSDFCTELIESNHIILGKTFAVTEQRIYGIIQYMEKPNEKIHAVKGILSEGM